MFTWFYLCYFEKFHRLFLYAILQTGRFMVLWCPSVRVSIRPSVTVFRTFLLHALTHWVEICMYFLLNIWTIDQVRVSSISVNCCWNYAHFGTLNTGNAQFSAIFSYMLWHIELTFYVWLCLTVLQIKVECRQFASIFVWVMSLIDHI